MATPEIERAFQLRAQARNFERPGREWMRRLIPDGLMESRHMKEIMALALPAFGTILADPLMSLIDTACVGQAGSLQLAAMGPITAIFNFVFQVSSGERQWEQRDRERGMSMPVAMQRRVLRADSASRKAAVAMPW